MPGRPDHAVHDVLLLVEGDDRVGLPAAAQHLQRAGGRARLALHLAVRRLLGAAAEDDQRGEQAEQQAADDRHRPVEEPALRGQHPEQRRSRPRRRPGTASSRIRPSRVSVRLAIR